MKLTIQIEPTKKILQVVVDPKSTILNLKVSSTCSSAKKRIGFKHMSSGQSRQAEEIDIRT